MSHTAGPWHWDDEGGHFFQAERRRAEKSLAGVVFARELVAGHQWVMGSGADFGSGPFDLVIATREDARLIAAAPDLLDALRLALLGLRQWQDEQRRDHPESVDGWLAIRQAEQAIARVEGVEVVT